MKVAIYMDLSISRREGLLSSLAPRWIEFFHLFCADFEEVRLCLPVDSDVTPEMLQKLGFPPNLTLISFPYYLGPDQALKRSPELFWRGLREGFRQARECDLICYNSPSLVGCIFATWALLRGRAQVEFIRGNKLQVFQRAYRSARGWFYYAANWLFDAWMDLVRHLGRVVAFTHGSALGEKYEWRNRGHVFPMKTMVSATYLKPLSEVEAAVERRLSSPIILFVGRLSPEKGIETLLNAASILLRDNYKFSLRIVGAGSEEMGLRQLATDLELESCVEWAGQVSYGPDLFREYDNATAFVLPSLSEGSPDVIAEAMARGVPIVASRVGGIPDLIEENETGLLVDAGDSRQLADAILRLMSDTEMRRRFAVNARAEVASHTLQDQYRQMLAILREKFALTTKPESSVGDVEVAE